MPARARATSHRSFNTVDQHATVAAGARERRRLGDEPQRRAAQRACDRDHGRGHPRIGQRLRQPQPGAAAQAVAAEVARLEPSAGATLQFRRRVVDHQAFGRHRQKRRRDIRDQHRRIQQRQRRGIGGNRAGHENTQRADQAREQIPGLARQRRVRHRRPQEFPGLRDVAGGDERGDLFHADAGLRQLIADRHREIPAHRSEGNDQEHEYARVGSAHRNGRDLSGSLGHFPGHKDSSPPIATRT